MGADKFKKRKREQRRRSEKLRKWKSEQRKPKPNPSKLFLHQLLINCLAKRRKLKSRTYSDDKNNCWNRWKRCL